MSDISHKSGRKLPVLPARVAFPASGLHRPLTSNKLYKGVNNLPKVAAKNDELEGGVGMRVVMKTKNIVIFEDEDVA